MATYSVDSASLVSVADAIREKAGLTGALAFPEGFAQAIADITTGGGSLQTATGSTSYSTTSGYTYTVSGIAFKPVFVIIYCTARTNAQGVRLAVLAPTISLQTSSGNPVKATSYALTEGGFTATLTVNWQYSGGTMTWIAYG